MSPKSWRTAAFVAAACLLAAGNCDRDGQKGTADVDATYGSAPAGAADGETCGTIAGIVCAGADSYCAIPAGQCGFPDIGGVCAPKPQACTLQFDPVCGCDGKTYGNACGAAAAGINVQSPGECPPGPL